MFRINSVGLMVVLLSACVSVPVGPSQDEKASKINVQLGVGYYHQNNLEMANEKLLKALAQDPESSQAHYAYAVLQNHFQDKEKTEQHFRKAIDLDPKNSEALSNFGAYLCNDGRIKESEKLFMQAVRNPLYKSPEVAYTNAALCVMKLEPPEVDKATTFLQKALAVRNNFLPALISISEISFGQKKYELTHLYLQRFHLVTQPTARSLWLDVRNELARGNSQRVKELANKLKQDFPESDEYQSWLALQQ